LKQAVPLSRYLAFALIALGGCALDLATKRWMFANLESDGQTWWIWDGVFGFQTSLNEGALFGFGQGLWPLFAALSVIAAVGIFTWLFLVGAARDWLLTIALAFVTAGILGNLYDRLGLWNDTFHGHQMGEPVHAVRDFILVMIGRLHWPNFNLADSSLVCGAALLLWHAIFTKVEDGEKSADEEQSVKQLRS
jgi:signal peptidase II